MTVGDMTTGPGVRIGPLRVIRVARDTPREARPRTTLLGAIVARWGVDLAALDVPLCHEDVAADLDHGRD